MPTNWTTPAFQQIELQLYTKNRTTPASQQIELQLYTIKLNYSCIQTNWTIVVFKYLKLNQFNDCYVRLWFDVAWIKAKLVISSFSEPRFPGKSKSEAIYDGGLLNLLSPSVVYFHPRAIYTFFFLSLQIDNFLSPFKLFSLFKWTRSGHSQVWRLRRGCLVGHRIRLKDVERTCSRRCCRWKSTLEESSACQTDQSWLPSGNSSLI